MNVGDLLEFSHWEGECYIDDHMIVWYGLVVEIHEERICLDSPTSWEVTLLYSNGEMHTATITDCDFEVVK